MTTHHRHLGVLSALLLAAGACVGPPGSVSSDDMGILSASLTLSPTASLDTANYAISGPNAFKSAGSIDVSHSQTISATIGGIPAGDGYSVSITGTATDGVTTCSGSATFSITPRRPPPLHQDSVPRAGPDGQGPDQRHRQRLPGRRRGRRQPGRGDGRVPSAIAPRRTTPTGSRGADVFVGREFGMLAGATTATPTLNCTAVGASTLTLTVSDGDCTDTAP